MKCQQIYSSYMGDVNAYISGVKDASAQFIREKNNPSQTADAQTKELPQQNVTTPVQVPEQAPQQKK